MKPIARMEKDSIWQNTSHRKVLTVIPLKTPDFRNQAKDTYSYREASAHKCWSCSLIMFSLHVIPRIQITAFRNWATRGKSPHHSCIQAKQVIQPFLYLIPGCVTNWLIQWYLVKCTAKRSRADTFACRLW